MQTFSVKKFQNTPRNDRGIAAAGTKRTRLSQANFEDDSVPGHTRSLHPTKGWRSRNLEVLRRNGEFVRNLDEKRPAQQPKKQKSIFVDDKVYGRREIRLSANKYA